MAWIHHSLWQDFELQYSKCRLAFSSVHLVLTESSFLYFSIHIKNLDKLKAAYTWYFFVVSLDASILVWSSGF